jgi:S-adenosylmethionine synthetase
MGRTPEIKTVRFESPNGEVVEKEVETFTWEKLDYVEKIKETFGIQ